MSGIASRFQATATRLLAKFDERAIADQIQLSRVTTTYNPTTKEDEQGAPVLTSIVGIVSEFSRDSESAGALNGNTIQSGDLLLVTTSATEPLMGDKVLMDGNTYSMVGIDPTRYTNTTILYELHIRR